MPREGKSTSRVSHSLAKMNISGDYRCWRGCGETGTLLHYWWECKMVQPLWKTVWRFLKKLKIDLLYDPAIALLGIYPRDTGVLMHRGTCTPNVYSSTFNNIQIHHVLFNHSLNRRHFVFFQTFTITNNAILNNFVNDTLDFCK